MSFPRELLNEDEELILDLNPHWWTLNRPAAALAGAVLLGVLALAFGAPTGLYLVVGVLLLIALAWFVAEYVKWYTTSFVVTSERVVYRSGFISKRGIEIPLDKINTVFFNQTVFERMLGSGDLSIESAGENGRQEFSNVRKPNAVHQEINRQIDYHSDRKLERIVQRSGNNAPEASIPDQIEHLARLRDQGILTPYEFEAKKTQLLDRM